VIQELKRRIDSGELGELYLVRTIGMDAIPPDPAYLPTSGGIFRDLFIHDPDAVPSLVGQPVVQVHAVGSVLVDQPFADSDDVDTAVITLTFAGGVIAQRSATIPRTPGSAAVGTACSPTPASRSPTRDHGVHGDHETRCGAPRRPPPCTPSGMSYRPGAGRPSREWRWPPSLTRRRPVGGR
jgi:predicted dehydrogenase